eukprot:GFYU01003156.1.p1 GENE.GFYU01003156.1~~GFYU01003156.1.p1  ORF type:complete len:447 (-),score=97.31 GFYU01003156.1:151-1491(-)
MFKKLFRSNSEAESHESAQSSQRPKSSGNPWNESLRKAAGRGNMSTVTALVTNPEYSVDVNACDKNGWTPLIEAANEGHADVVRFLARHGARVDARAKDGCSAMHYAAAAGDTDTIDVLAYHGLDLECKTDQGWTALHLACHVGELAVIRKLLELGADTNSKTRKFELPVDLSHDAAVSREINEFFERLKAEMRKNHFNRRRESSQESMQSSQSQPSASGSQGNGHVVYTQEETALSTRSLIDFDGPRVQPQSHTQTYSQSSPYQQQHPTPMQPPNVAHMNQVGGGTGTVLNVASTMPSYPPSQPTTTAANMSAAIHSGVANMSIGGTVHANNQMQRESALEELNDLSEASHDGALESKANGAAHPHTDTHAAGVESAAESGAVDVSQLTFEGFVTLLDNLDATSLSYQELSKLEDRLSQKLRETVGEKTKMEKHYKDMDMEEYLL